MIEVFEVNILYSPVHKVGFGNFSLKQTVASFLSFMEDS